MIVHGIRVTEFLEIWTMKTCHARIRAFLLLVICILVTSILYCLFGSEQKPLQNIYNNNLSSSIDKIKRVVVPAVEENRNYYLNPSNLVTNQGYLDKYLNSLGFTKNVRLFPDNVWTNVSLPVFVTAITSRESSSLRELLKSLQDYYPEATIIVYDLNLDDEEAYLVKNICNSTVSCSLRKFMFKSFPSHLRDLQLFAFRPIIMQEVLNQAGAALWIDPKHRLTPLATDRASRIFEAAKKDGIKCWTTVEPTTAMTHPKMFEYFNTSPEAYYFLRMIEPSSLIIIYNTDKIHKEVMLPWVRCSLIPDCISPIGAQSSGCRYNKKPLYRYSGCHHYDLSALSILLGSVYENKLSKYSIDQKDKFYKPILPEELEDVRHDYNQYPARFRGISTVDSTQRHDG